MGLSRLGSRLRTRRCVGRHTPSGRRVREGGLREFPAANSFAPWADAADSPIRSHRIASPRIRLRSIASPAPRSPLPARAPRTQKRARERLPARAPSSNADPAYRAATVAVAAGKAAVVLHQPMNARRWPCGSSPKARGPATARRPRCCGAVLRAAQRIPNSPPPPRTGIVPTCAAAPGATASAPRATAAPLLAVGCL